jgi:GUN4-like
MSDLNDDLSSAVGIDYRNLRNCLAVKDFESANKETKSIFQKISYINLNLSDPDPENMITPRIPCTDICTIDRLWVKYSQGRFGISVQHDIWINIYASLYKEKQEFDKREKIERDADELSFWAQEDAWSKLNDIVGWKSNNFGLISLIYQVSAPQGHLPLIYSPNNINHYSALIGLFIRLRSCLQ